MFLGFHRRSLKKKREGSRTRLGNIQFLSVQKEKLLVSYTWVTKKKFSKSYQSLATMCSQNSFNLLGNDSQSPCNTARGCEHHSSKIYSLILHFEDVDAECCLTFRLSTSYWRSMGLRSGSCKGHSIGFTSF